MTNSSSNNQLVDIIDALTGDEVEQYKLAKKALEEAQAKFDESTAIFNKIEKRYNTARNKIKKEFQTLTHQMYSDNEITATEALAKARELKKKWNL